MSLYIVISNSHIINPWFQLIITVWILNWKTKTCSRGSVNFKMTNKRFAVQLLNRMWVIYNTYQSDILFLCSTLNTTLWYKNDIWKYGFTVKYTSILVSVLILIPVVTSIPNLNWHPTKESWLASGIPCWKRLNLKSIDLLLQIRWFQTWWLWPSTS